MAIGTGLAIAMAASAAVSTAGSVYAAKKQSSASRAATDASERANTEALEVEREERDYDRQIDVERYGREQQRIDRLERIDQERHALGEARNTRDENFTRERYNANAAYRATGKASLGALAALAGLQVGDLASEKVAMVPTAPPSSVPFTPQMPVQAQAGPPQAGGLPPVGEDGLVEMTMSPEAYQQFSQSYTPTPRPNRQPIGALIGAR